MLVSIAERGRLMATAHAGGVPQLRKVTLRCLQLTCIPPADLAVIVDPDFDADPDT